MTIRVSADGGEPVDLVDFAEDLLRECAEEIARVVNRVSRGEFDELKALRGQVRDLRDVIVVIQDERTRVAKLRKQVAGLVGTGELDFQSARDEVGRRLARLQGAGPG